MTADARAPARKGSRVLRILNAVLALPAAASLGFAIKHGFERGQDMQWSGAHLLLQGIDPYSQFLRGDPEHRILLSQVPNYLQELYLLLLPLGMLPFQVARGIFVVCNLAMAAACVILLSRLYTLDGPRTLLLGLVFVSTTAFRQVVSNGQNAILEMLLLVLLVSPAAAKPLWLGLSYFKYSFSPVFVFFLVFRARWRLLLGSLLPPAVGVLVFWLIVHGSLLRDAVEPLVASRRGVSPGLGDIAAVVVAAMQMFHVERSLTAGFAIGLLSAVCLAWLIASRAAPGTAFAPASFAALVPASLLCLVHLPYDYVLLLAPFAATLGWQGGASASNRRSLRRAVSLISIGLLWFVAPGMSGLSLHLPVFVMQLCVCMLLACLGWCHLPGEEKSA